MSINIVVTFGMILAFLAFCDPIKSYWNPLLHVKKCTKTKYHFMLTVAANIVIDIALFVIPIPVVRRVQTTMLKRVGILSIFGLGIVIIAIALWQLLAMVVPIKDLANFQRHSYGLFDYTVREPYNYTIQNLLQVWLSLIVANIIPSAPLMSRLLPMKMKDVFSRAPSEAQRKLEQKRIAALNFRMDPHGRRTDIDRASKIVDCEKRIERTHGISIQQDFQVTIDERTKPEFDSRFLHETYYLGD